MRPYFDISAGGQSITGPLSQFSLALTIVDSSGKNADNLQLDVSDPNGVFAVPSTGQTLGAIAGYVDQVRNFGDFIVDQVSFAGYPQTITVSAQSADAMSAQKQKRTESYTREEYPTYGSIFQKLAGRNGLSLAISPSLASKTVVYEAQSEEDDIAFATRIAKKIDGGVTVKSGRLVVIQNGAGLSASGLSLPSIVVAPGLNLLADGGGYQVTLVDKPKHGTVKATWFDRQKARNTVVIKETGSSGPEFVIRQPFQSEEDATKAAEAKVKELSRAGGSATFSIAGDPYAQAEAFVQVAGVRPGVDGPWRAKTVSHYWSGSKAYTTTLECEIPTA
ncbi:MAG: late control protein D [Roseibium sp.]|nr:late control protein D [Roseibium sp.]